MISFLPPGHLLVAFVLASFVLAVTPGPGVFYIVTRTLSQGRRAGLASVAGVAAGNFGSSLAASLGLAALFAVSSVAFTVVRYAGAAYLVFLGVKALRAREPKRKHEAETRELETVNLGRLFRDGFVVALLNPKTTVFFAAFLPQFMSAAAPLGESLFLGSLFVGLAAITDTAYALGASVLGPRLTRARGARTVGRYATGSALIGLGLFTAVAGSRRAR